MIFGLIKQIIEKVHCWYRAISICPATDICIKFKLIFFVTQFDGVFISLVYFG